MKTILVVFLLALPLVMAATLPREYEGLTAEEIEKRMSLGTIVALLKSLDLGPGCVDVCEKHVHGFWRTLCEGACKVVLGY